MIKETLTTLMTAVGRLPDLFRSAKSGSLVEYTQTTRVEPIVLVDQTALHLPYMQDVMLTLTSIFAGYYLQGVAISVNVGRVDVIKLLEKLNPSRSPSDNAGMLIGDLMLTQESYIYKLPTFHNQLQPGMESDSATPERSMSLGRDTTAQINQVANLSAGVLLDVQIEDGGNKASIPVAVRLIASAISPTVLNQILANSSTNTTVKERYHAWRSGQLEFIRDLILCQDLIDAHREALMKDNTGQYSEILRRKSTNRIAALLSASPSVATASNIVVTTTASVTKLELDIGGRLRDFKVRERIFKNTYLMLMVVIDPAMEMATIYTRGIAIPNEVTVKGMKNANKGGGSDVGEILKAYQLGNSPSL